MSIIDRRTFLLASMALPMGCVQSRHDAVPSGAAQLRPPAVGQSWRYAQRDYYTRAVLETQVDQVALVGRTIDINSHTEGGAARHPNSTSSWGANWLHPYADAARPRTELPSEVQSSWGMVLVDPHWTQVQVFKDPVPLWPAVLQPGWRTHINTRYKTTDEGAGLPWDQTMKAEAWEPITVPAGSFNALRFVNLINFRSNDPTRSDSVRRETIWLVPEIGRWAARESSGSFYVDDSAVDQPYNESSYRWELLEWT